MIFDGENSWLARKLGESQISQKVGIPKRPYPRDNKGYGVFGLGRLETRLPAVSDLMGAGKTMHFGMGRAWEGRR